MNLIFGKAMNLHLFGIGSFCLYVYIICEKEEFQKCN